MNTLRKLYRWFFPPKITIVRSGHETGKDLAFPREFARRVGKWKSTISGRRLSQVNHERNKNVTS